MLLANLWRINFISCNFALKKKLNCLQYINYLKLFILPLKMYEKKKKKKTYMASVVSSDPMRTRWDTIQALAPLNKAA
jgi:hypothetical protein